MRRWPRHPRERYPTSLRPPESPAATPGGLSERQALVAIQHRGQHAADSRLRKKRLVVEMYQQRFGSVPVEHHDGMLTRLAKRYGWIVLQFADTNRLHLALTTQEHSAGTTWAQARRPSMPARGLRIVARPETAFPERNPAETTARMREAMRPGVDIVYQGRLQDEDGRWPAIPTLLLRVGEASATPASGARPWVPVWDLRIPSQYRSTDPLPG